MLRFLLNINNEQWKTDATEIISQIRKKTPIIFSQVFWLIFSLHPDLDHCHSEGWREDLHKESNVPLQGMLQVARVSFTERGGKKISVLKSKLEVWSRSMEIQN